MSSQTTQPKTDEKPKRERAVFTSALVIIPPESIWSQIQEIRKQHDRAFQRWMPHVNLMFPFVHFEKFEDATKTIEKAVSSVKPFKVAFKNIKYFGEKSKSVVWVDPETEVGYLGITS